MISFDYTDYGRRKTVKVRKEHQCQICRSRIIPGDKAHAYTYFPKNNNKDVYKGLVAPRTLYVCFGDHT